MKSQQIQDQINQIDTQIKIASSQEQVDRLNDQKAGLEARLAVALADESGAVERTQAQAAAVESIVLPLDFNELFDNTAANDTIIEIVREFRTKDYADHNAELAQVNADWTDRVKTVEAQKDDLQTSLENATRQVLEKIAERDEFSQRCKQAELDKQDAESKRDNATNELKDANAEIYRLNQLIALPAPEPKTVEISTNDRLADLAVKAKQSAADSAARAVARWNEANPTLAVPDLEIPKSLPQVTAEPAAGATPQVPTAAVGLDGNGDTAQVVGAETQDAVTDPIPLDQQLAALQQSHDALTARVIALESVSGRVAA